MKWNELYTSEQALIDDMLITKSDPKVVPYGQLVKGYEYVNGFKKYYNEHGTLTDKQMTQLKRLASSIYNNVHYDNIMIV